MPLLDAYGVLEGLLSPYTSLLLACNFVPAGPLLCGACVPLQSGWGYASARGQGAEGAGYTGGIEGLHFGDDEESEGSEEDESDTSEEE
jgi:hypothetical protein